MHETVHLSILHFKKNDIAKAIQSYYLTNMHICIPESQKQVDALMFTQKQVDAATVEDAQNYITSRSPPIIRRS